MINMSSLQDTTRYRKKSRRVGRGPGCGKGKTCGRGEKGAGSRSGYKRRYTYEGGQFRTYMKMPIRGFNNAEFTHRYEPINLAQIEEMYQDGETVNVSTLAERGFVSGRNIQIKVLGNGELTKKVKIEAHAFSKSAKEKLQSAKIPFTINE